MSVNGGEPKAIDQNSYEQRNPSFSRDGRWIYFNSNRGGLVQIWRRRVDGSGQPECVTARRGYDAAESRDGSVYFLPAMAEPGIWYISRNTRAEQILLPTITFLVRRQWDMVNDNLYFLGNDAQSHTLLRLRKGAANAESVMQLDNEVIPGVNAIAVSPDERFLVYAYPEAMRSDLMAIATTER
jgi:Tol biopolymer transport system component